MPGDGIVFTSTGAATDLAESTPDHLSHGDILRLSVTRSPEVQAAIARVRIAQAEARQARLLPNPVLSVALRFSDDGGKPVIDAGLTADLLKVLTRPQSVRAADARLRAASAEAVTVVLDIASEAQVSFATVQGLEASVRVLNERGSLMRRLVDLAESRLKLGEGTRLDVATVHAQRLELAEELADKQLELRDARLVLARLIGQPSSGAQWALPEWSPNDGVIIPEAAAIAAAFERRPEVRQREWQLQALGAERKLTTWALLDGADVGAAAEREDEWTLGPSATLPLPLFDTGQQMRARAEAAVIEARHQLTAARRQVVEDVRRAHAALIGAIASLHRVDHELLPVQEQRLAQGEAQLQGGQTDVTALLLAEQDLRAARLRRVELQQRVAIARVRLERAVGGAGATQVTAQPPSTQPAN
jgi:outer membrane protein TolC